MKLRERGEEEQQSKGSGTYDRWDAIDCCTNIVCVLACVLLAMQGRHYTDRVMTTELRPYETMSPCQAVVRWPVPTGVTGRTCVSLNHWANFREDSNSGQ
ncbi:hypothetical protein E2C01_049522 [Portunus trituberculatus]|uniref:Uncharacterized protein n=1 Tax=Portunus trituberculatus TaxID=210409 RepID=A0A5B7G5T9_PORTR|nr:hypothetical protein [Portunus trituberculatus]